MNCELGDYNHIERKKKATKQVSVNGVILNICKTCYNRLGIMQFEVGIKK